MAIRVLLVTNELATATAVTAALESNGKLASEDICRDLTDLVDHLNRSPVPAVLVDIDAQPQRMLSSLDPIVRKFSDTRFVVLSGSQQSDLLFEAMQAGARHFMVKNSIGADLSGVLHRLCPNGATSRQGGLITVLSASGGCGATTVAVNLANELQLANSEEALIVDVDYNYGSVGAYLGLDGQFGLMDLLARTGPLDGQLVETSALSYSPNLDALISVNAAQLGETVQINSQRMQEAIDACRDSYPFTVVDAPRIPMTLAADLAKRSTATLVVFQLTVKDIRIARATLTALSERGADPQKLIPVISRYRKRTAMVPLDEAKKALGREQVTCISNDYSAASESINLGKLLAQTAPRSDLRKDVQQLAADLSKRHTMKIQKAAR